MDRTSSRYSNSSMCNKTTNKPPFKLCFPMDHQQGRSSLCHSQLDGNTTTPQFYTREYKNLRDMNVSEQVANQEERSPKNTHHWPLLTSQMYGWWYERGIQPRGSKQSLSFHKNTSDLVNLQMKIYAEDRKLRGLKR